MICAALEQVTNALEPTGTFPADSQLRDMVNHPNLCG